MNHIILTIWQECAPINPLIHHDNHETIDTSIIGVSQLKNHTIPRRPHQLSAPHPGQLRAPWGDGISSSGVALQGLRSPRTKIPLAKGQPAAGARHTLQTECDRPADRESAAQRHGDVCVRGVERIWQCRGGWQAAGERSVSVGWWVYPQYYASK